MCGRIRLVGQRPLLQDQQQQQPLRSRPTTARLRMTTSCTSGFAYLFSELRRGAYASLSRFYISAILSSSRMMMIKLSWTAIKSCARNEQWTSKEGTRFSGYCIWRKWFLSMSAAATTTAVVVLCRDIL